MRTDESMNRIYDAILNNMELTTRLLNSFGLNSGDLTYLVKENHLIRLKRGVYSLKNVEGLFSYGKRLFLQENYEKAALCFQKCYEMDLAYLESYFQLFLMCIENKDYNKAFILFDKLFEISDEVYKIDANYYLYLLSIVTEVPDKWKDYAANLQFDDIKIPFENEKYKNIILENRIRMSVFNGQFKMACNTLIYLVKEIKGVTLQDKISKNLISQIFKQHKRLNRKISILIKDKKYEEISSLLTNVRNKSIFSINELYTLKLVNDLIEIKDTLTVPEILDKEVQTAFDAIDAKNYRLALQLNDEYFKEHNLSKEKSFIYILLRDIIRLIDSLERENQEDIKCDVKYPNKKYDQMFSSFISCLLKNDLDNAFVVLKDYLNSIQKSEFEFLVVDLIKIGLLEKDFSKSISLLVLLTELNYKFDLSFYIQEFYLNLSENKFEIARLYLDIINKANKLGQDCVILDGLYQILESSEKLLNYGSKKDDLVHLEEEKISSNSTDLSGKNSDEFIPSLETSTDVSKKEEVKKENVEVSKTIQSASVSKFNDSDLEFVKRKCQELSIDNALILLKPMSDERTHRIIDITRSFDYVVSFVIERENNRQVVLKYKDFENVYLDVKNLFYLGNKAYVERNYDECIELYSKLLVKFDAPKAYVYSKLGLSYLKKDNVSLAIDYLTVATEVSKRDGLNFDFNELILKLKGYTSDEEIKPVVKMSQSDFEEDDINNYYGVLNFEELNAFICESNLDIVSACQQMNLTLEQIDIVRLIYAKMFYAQGNFKKGDLFLKAYEKSENKTDNTIKLFNEIRTNKKFYQNREVSSPVQLSLKLMP